MAQKWDSEDGTFHLGINMAGAVSAGAYTAGVLDFLMEAVEQWYAAKDSGAAVPRHKVSIDVFSGASAGGMCAAIAAVMVQGGFEHIQNPADATVTGTSNKFYESWVNRIDIDSLLQANDLAGGKPVVSLLDSTIIDQIADYALAPVGATPKPYISKSLTLFLALTNVRGAPFSLNGNAAGSAEEDIAYYADRLQFETVEGSSAPLSPGAKPLPVGASTAGAWPLLKEAAKATGAFPIFLAPRKLDRIAEDYMNSPWEPLTDTDPAPVPPHWPLQKEDTYTTLNIDGGVTDNDPFELAHDYLAIHNPLAEVDAETGELKNPDAPDRANCAVLTVAPFPADALYDPKYDFSANSGIFGMLPNLFTVLIAQSRFLGESLSAVMSDESFSRFVLAPSDTDHPNEQALQCASLSAFGGFFERGFRAHDYQLGRRNCQQFLRRHFRLSIDNPVIAAGLKQLDPAARAAAVATFDPEHRGTIPIIALCGSAAEEAPAPARATIAQARVNDIVNGIAGRLRAVGKPLLTSALGPGFKNFIVRSAINGYISISGKAKIKALLQKQLKSAISG